MYCSKCGKELADGAKFCPQCGAKVNTITPSDNKTPSQTDARAAANAAVENASKFMSNMLDKGAKSAKVLAEKATPTLKGIAEQAKVASEQAIVVAGELKEEAAKKINEIQEERAQQQQDASQEGAEAQSWSAKNYRLWKAILKKIPTLGNELQRLFHPLPNIVKYGCGWICTAWVAIMLLAGVAVAFSDNDSSTPSVAYEEHSGEQDGATPAQAQRKEAFTFNNETDVRSHICSCAFESEGGDMRINFMSMGETLSINGSDYTGHCEISIFSKDKAIIKFSSPGMNVKFALSAFEWGGLGLTDLASQEVYLSK